MTLRSGGVSQPKPPPALIASSAAWHRSERSPRDRPMMTSTLVSGFGISLMSRNPLQEALEESQPYMLALLGMELYAQQVVVPDDGGHRPAIFHGRDDILRPLGHEMVGVDEVGVVAAPGVGQRRVNALELQVVPAHLGDAQAAIGGIQHDHLALDPVEALVLAELDPDARHQLHADADAEERPGLLQRHLLQ